MTAQDPKELAAFLTSLEDYVPTVRSLCFCLAVQLQRHSRKFARANRCVVGALIDSSKLSCRFLTS